MKTKTIWHYAFRFFQSEEDMDDTRHHELGSIKPYYAGEIAKLSYEKASKIAQIHPNCLKYYEDAMAPLFQGKGWASKGTEDPVMALESYKTKAESQVDMPYIFIWKIFNA